MKTWIDCVVFVFLWHQMCFSWENSLWILKKINHRLIFDDLWLSANRDTKDNIDLEFLRSHLKSHDFCSRIKSHGFVLTLKAMVVTAWVVIAPLSGTGSSHKTPENPLLVFFRSSHVLNKSFTFAYLPLKSNHHTSDVGATPFLFHLTAKAVFGEFFFSLGVNEVFFFLESTTLLHLASVFPHVSPLGRDSAERSRR